MSSYICAFILQCANRRLEIQDQITILIDYLDHSITKDTCYTNILETFGLITLLLSDYSLVVL